MKRFHFYSVPALLVAFALSVSCGVPDGGGTGGETVSCPARVAARALDYAEKYAAADTVYQWGGQDPLRSIRVDCSGLAVNCYAYAAADLGFSLPFTDAAVIDFYRQWTIPASAAALRPGDLIFMGEADADRSVPTHMGIFVKKEGGEIRFIDSTKKDDIDGVSERSYAENDPRLYSFGVLLLLSQ